MSFRSDQTRITSHSASHPMIATEHLSKVFGKFRAVDDVSLSVAQGEIYGFLGLNGAGKTTTIRMLLGMIRPSGGTARIAGQQIRQERGPWEKIGSLVEVPSAYPELTVYENLEISRRMRGLPEPSIGRVIDLLNLGQYSNRRAGELSLGNAQRLGLARALIHEPSILILDEPTNGLDPAGIAEVRQLLIRLAADQGVTIFISSHILGEIARMATRIGIIHNGRLVEEMSAGELHRHREKRLVLHTRNNDSARAVLEAAGFAPAATKEGALALAEPRALEQPDVVAALLVRAGQALLSLQNTEEDLESHFLRLIGPDKTGKTGAGAKVSE